MTGCVYGFSGLAEVFEGFLYLAVEPLGLPCQINLTQTGCLAHSEGCRLEALHSSVEFLFHFDGFRDLGLEGE